MEILLFILLYISINFMLYTFILRKLKPFSTERVIFLYHVLSLLFLILLISIILITGNTKYPLSIFIGALSIHGIYSLTFLECWSLSEGGYSINILNLCLEMSESQLLLQKLEAIGDKKFQQRLDSLSRLGILENNNDSLKITCYGKIVTIILRVFTFATNRRDIG